MFEGVNYLAVLVAAVAAFIFGGLWYGLLANRWMSAANISAQDLNKPKSPLETATPYLIAFLGQFVMALFLAGLLAHFGSASMSLKGGLLTAASVWLGFILPAMAVNHAFQGAKRELTLIDSGHWLGVLLIQALVIVSIG